MHPHLQLRCGFAGHASIVCGSQDSAAKQQPSRSIPFPLVLRRRYLLLQPRAEAIMQSGSVVGRTRKTHSDIWQFRWREKKADGKTIYRRRQIGTVDQIPNVETAIKAAFLLVPDLNARAAKSKPVSITIAPLCSHFEQCELSLANTWRSLSFLKPTTIRDFTSKVRASVHGRAQEFFAAFAGTSPSLRCGKNIVLVLGTGHIFPD